MGYTASQSILKGVFLLLCFSACICIGLTEARKCRREAEDTSCGPISSCIGDRKLAVTGLCDDKSHVCCIPGRDDVCRAHHGTCVKSSDCPSEYSRVSSFCPGTSQIVCCISGNVTLPDPDESYPKLPVKADDVQDEETRQKLEWNIVVKNKISDLTDFLLDNMTRPIIGRHPKMCWPLTKSSTKKATVTLTSFASPREGGKSCHTGIDMYTSAPGEVLSIAHGQVLAILPNFATCASGWGLAEVRKNMQAELDGILKSCKDSCATIVDPCHETCMGTHPCLTSCTPEQISCFDGCSSMCKQHCTSSCHSDCDAKRIKALEHMIKFTTKTSSAVIVYHPDLDATILYGEIDSDSVKVREGKLIGKGDLLGVATYCGMLHLEMYKFSHSEPVDWSLPLNAEPLDQYADCLKRYPESMPKHLLDPRPLLTSLEGKYCV